MLRNANLRVAFMKILTKTSRIPLIKPQRKKLISPTSKIRTGELGKLGFEAKNLLTNAKQKEKK